MTYEICCFATESGWRYVVRLWCGTVYYTGNRTYDRHCDAVKAARRTGAKEKLE